MKTTLLTLVSVLTFCGCAHREASFSQTAVDLVQPGTDVAWKDGMRLRVAKRNGDSVEDIRITKKAADGKESTVIAKSGTLVSGSREKPEDRNVVSLTLREVQGEMEQVPFTASEIIVVLAR